MNGLERNLYGWNWWNGRQGHTPSYGHDQLRLQSHSFGLFGPRGLWDRHKRRCGLQDDHRHWCGWSLRYEKQDKGPDRVYGQRGLLGRGLFVLFDMGGLRDIHRHGSGC